MSILHSGSLGHFRWLHNKRVNKIQQSFISLSSSKVKIQFREPQKYMNQE